MTEESTQNKRALEAAGAEAGSSTERQFGPEQIVEMNQNLLDQTITLYLPPEYDKRLLPVKAKALRNWWEVDEKTKMHARFCLPLTMASGLGYYILSPATFTVEWDGEPTHDTVITIIDASSHCVIDNHSSFSSFTVQSRFIGRTKNIGDFIYIKGVANQPRSPFHVMEAMIESWWSPSEFGVVCLVNQPGKFTIQKGEPLAQMFVINAQQAQYGLAVTEGYPPFWEEWKARRDPAIYNGRNMDYLRGLLPDQTPVCPHMKSWSEAQVSDTGDMSVQQIWTAGDIAKTSGNFDEAVRRYTHAMQLAEQEKEITEQLLRNLKSASNDLQRSGQHAQSVTLLKRCVALSERYAPPTGFDFTPELFSDLGWSYRTTGDLDNAVEVFQEALKRKRAANVAPLSLARALVDLGTLHDLRMKREEAIPFMQEAKEIYKQQNLSDDNVDYLYFKNVYGCLLTHIGRYEEAQELYDQVIRERIKLFGADSLEVADTYRDLGFHYKEMKNYSQSENYFQMNIANRIKHKGKDDLDVAFAYEDLAWMFRQAGDLLKAKQQLENVLEIRKKKLYPNDNLLRGTMLSMDEVCRQLDEKAKS